MEKREAARCSAELLLKDVTEATLMCPDGSELYVGVVDLSSQGLRVYIPASHAVQAIPCITDTADIVFHSVPLRLKCRCIYSMNNTDNSTLIGLYVFDPVDQSNLRDILALIP